MFFPSPFFYSFINTSNSSTFPENSGYFFGYQETKHYRYVIKYISFMQNMITEEHIF